MNTLENKLLIIFCAIFLGSCLNTGKPSETILSPSGNFGLKTEINNNKQDGSKYLCVKLLLLDNADKQLSGLQTGCSDVMKWAIGWHPVNDTIIMNSRDRGIYAWRIDKSKQLISLENTSEIDSLAGIILKKKYKEK